MERGRICGPDTLRIFMVLNHLWFELKMYPTFQTLMTNNAMPSFRSSLHLINGGMRNESIVGLSFIKFCPQHALSGHSTITLTFKDFFGFRKPNIWISTYLLLRWWSEGHSLQMAATFSLFPLTLSLFQQSQSSSSRLLGHPLVSDHTVSRSVPAHAAPSDHALSHDDHDDIAPSHDCPQSP